VGTLCLDHRHPAAVGCAGGARGRASCPSPCGDCAASWSP